jgi:uncharacterized protein YdeI (YjbR/CyaY-like superfamily)
MAQDLEPGPDGRQRVMVETRADWRAWLALHHARPQGVWLVTWRTATGRPAPTYEEQVEEALCVGWVDSTAGRLDEERKMLWFSPRRRGSAWSRPNKERVVRLEAAGLMRDAGRRAIAVAKEEGTWSLLDDVEDGVVPDDLAAAFAAVPGSRERWEAFPRSARRGILEWIVQAKRPETRAARVTETATLAARGERANQWTPKERR